MNSTNARFGGPPVTRLHIHVLEPGPDGTVRVSLSGELDRDEVQRLRAAVDEVVEAHPATPVRIDGRDLTFLDSGGVRGLLDCREAVGRRGAGLSMPQVTPFVFEVLELTRLLGVLGVEEICGAGPRRPLTGSRAVASRVRAPGAG